MEILARVFRESELRAAVDDFMARGGNEQLKATIARAGEASRKLAESQRLDYDTLREPMTI